VDQSFDQRAWLGGAATAALLGAVVSGGIVVQRIAGTAITAVAANAVTTVAAVVVVYATVRAFTGNPRALALAQCFGALAGVALVHLVLRRMLAQYPWVHEQPRQLVNDLVGVFGVLTIVWGCARAVVRPLWMIAGLSLLLGYELTARYWHLDAPVPLATALPWSIQRFVGSEVTASGIGVVVFRLVFE